MIMQNDPGMDSAAIAETLTNAEAERVRLERALEESATALAEAEEMLAVAETAYAEGVNSI